MILMPQDILVPMFEKFDYSIYLDRKNRLNFAETMPISADLLHKCLSVASIFHWRDTCDFRQKNAASGSNGLTSRLCNASANV